MKSTMTSSNRLQVATKNLAANFATALFFMLSAVSVAAAAAPSSSTTRETVERVFSWPVAMQSLDGRPQMVPLRQSKEPRA